MSRWSFVICDTRTGTQKTPVFPASGGWERRLNAKVSQSHTFLLGDSTNKTIGYRACTTPWANTLVIQRDFGAGFGVKPWIAYAGIITGRNRNVDTNTLTIRHSDIRGLLARRTTLGANGYGGVDGGRDEILNLTLDSIAARIITDGMTGPTSNYSLPIVLPAPVTSVFSRTYWDYNFPFVDALLEEIQNYDGGPDTDFDPQWSSTNTLQWVFRSGYLTGGSFEWNMTADAPGLFDVSHDEDASKQATSVYAVGKGSEVDMKVKWARVDTTLPALERVEQYKDIDDEAILQGHANADLNAFKNPTNQWALSVLADGTTDATGVVVTPTLDKLVLGSTLTLYFKGDEWEPDGWVVLRLIGMTGDMSDKVKLIVQGGWVA